jgi:hypothetical protein
MEKQFVQKNTTAWRFQVWASFGLSVTMMCAGIYHLPLDWWMKGYLLMGLVFSIGSCFGLAKTLRDDHDTERQIKEQELVARPYKD